MTKKDVKNLIIKNLNEIIKIDKRTRNNAFSIAIALKNHEIHDEGVEDLINMNLNMIEEFDTDGRIFSFMFGIELLIGLLKLEKKEEEVR